ncbi:MAG TPA: sigma-70 family RNA polymerase sigma factor [Acidimicrobiia bacterium]
MRGDERWDADDVRSLRELYPGLRRFAAVVSRPDLDPDDLVQEAFTRALVARSRSEVPNLGAYLRRTIVNLAKNERRRLARGSVAQARLVPSEDAVTAPPSDLSDLLRLDPVSRGLLFLVEVEGASIREAAVAVGCTEAAARMRLSRARRRLRAELEAERRDE